MSMQNPFETYLTSRARSATPAGGSLGAVVARAARRRRRNRAMGGVAVGVLALSGGALVWQGVLSGPTSDTVASYGADSVESTLGWTMVGPVEGIGSTRAMVAADSGVLYGVSTAPVGGTTSETDFIYRSTDGANWAQTEAPRAMSVADLAWADDTLYAVGTGTAGGAVRLATSTGGGSWSVEDLPIDLDAIGDRSGLGVPVAVKGLQVITSGDTRLVVATVQAEVDLASLVEDEDNPTEWYPVAEGMRRSVACPTGASPTTGSVPSSTQMGDALGCTADGSAETRSWSDLGVSEEGGALIYGQSKIFATGRGGSFEPLASLGFTPMLQVLTDPAGGFWAIDLDSEVVKVEADGSMRVRDITVARYSADGIDWSAPASTIVGSPVAIGVLDGELQALLVDFVAGDEPAARLTLARLSRAGIYERDVTEAAGITSSPDRFVSSAAIGPLGLAVVTSAEDGEKQVAHSSDGDRFSITAIPAAPDGRIFQVNGITMSADAIKVRVNVYRDDQPPGGPTPPLEQRLFVGTPR